MTTSEPAAALYRVVVEYEMGVRVTGRPLPYAQAQAEAARRRREEEPRGGRVRVALDGSSWRNLSPSRNSQEVNDGA